MNRRTFLTGAAAAATFGTPATAQNYLTSSQIKRIQDANQYLTDLVKLPVFQNFLNFLIQSHGNDSSIQGYVGTMQSFLLGKQTEQFRTSYYRQAEVAYCASLYTYGMYQRDANGTNLSAQIFEELFSEDQKTILKASTDGAHYISDIILEYVLRGDDSYKERCGAVFRHSGNANPNIYTNPRGNFIVRDKTTNELKLAPQ